MVEDYYVSVIIDDEIVPILEVFLKEVMHATNVKTRKCKNSWAIECNVDSVEDFDAFLVVIRKYGGEIRGYVTPMPTASV